MESALGAVDESNLLDEAVVAIREADLSRRTGRVVDLIGLIVEATGLEAEVGEVCTIETGRGRPSVPAEVVGFRAGRTLLMALGEAVGIGPGARVTASGQPLSVNVERRPAGPRARRARSSAGRQRADPEPDVALGRGLAA